VLQPHWDGVMSNAGKPESMKITKVIAPVDAGSFWSGEAVSARQHYRWLIGVDGSDLSAQSDKLTEGGHVSRNGVQYSRLYKFLRRQPAALAVEVRRALSAG